jgi:methionine-gamma-lyase
MELITWLLHGDDGVGGPDSITPSIAQGLNWAADSADEFARVASAPMDPRLYTRHGNRNHQQVAAILNALEHGEATLLAASGMGAMTTAALSLLEAGDHVIGQRSMYGGVTSMLLNLLPRMGVGYSLVDQSDPDAFSAALRPETKLLLLETPSNPRLEITDLAAVSALAREHGARTLVDNTFATPVNQRPREHGIDLVMHSATKYLGGHSDLLAGVVTGDRALVEAMWDTAQVAGAILAPFNAWLLLRGLRTLSLRVERHNHNGQVLAEALEAHPAIGRVHYPGLASHPGHAIAARQMSGFGGVLSFEFAAGAAAADEFIDGLQLAKRASSLGDVTSLVVRPAALWAKSLTPVELEEAGVPPGLIRFSAGIEAPDDLLADVLAAADRAADSAGNGVR